MIVTWITQSRPEGTSQITYWIEGHEGEKKRSSGNWKSFNAGNLLFERKLYVHRVTIGNLSLGETYQYQVGNGILVSRIYKMRTLRNESDFVPKIAIYGDLGKDNGQSLPRLIHQADQKAIDIVLHIGDMAYDLNDDRGRHGDEFMRAIEPLASQVPYQTVAGNHEQAWNFSHYDHIFSNVDRSTGQINNHFYSTTIGPVRLIGIATEFYYFMIYGTSQMGVQYRWLENELREANRPENRAKQPWLVVMGHRPLYCTSRGTINNHCTLEYRALRNGWLGKYGLDKLFYENKVDVYFAGHSHSYERMFPVYGGLGNSSKITNPYHDPWAPVHIVAGSAGCKEKLHKFPSTAPDWSAVRVADYGYAMMYPLNRTNLLIEQISISQVRLGNELMLL